MKCNIYCILHFTDKRTNMQQISNFLLSEGEKDITDKMPIEEPFEVPVGEPPKASAIPIQCGDNIHNDNFLMTFDSMELFSEYS